VLGSSSRGLGAAKQAFHSAIEELQVQWLEFSMVGMLKVEGFKV
jgi:hypothetical protein